MEPTLEQAFTLELELLISQFITQGVAISGMEEIMQQALLNVYLKDRSKEDAE